MANKRYNHQTTNKFEREVSPSGNEHGSAMKRQWNPDKNIAPGLPGKASKWTAPVGQFEAVDIYPHSEGLK